jgi:hypothetical protein
MSRMRFRLTPGRLGQGAPDFLLEGNAAALRPRSEGTCDALVEIAHFHAGQVLAQARLQLGKLGTAVEKLGEVVVLCRAGRPGSRRRMTQVTRSS